MKGFASTFVSISYWHLIAPLTFFSAYLLLSKVRKKHELATEQPTENA
jgi:hypothetical protein